MIVPAKMAAIRSQLFFIPLFLLHVFFIFFMFDSSLAQIYINEDEEKIQRCQFPEGFFFGTSTSSYQVEGAIFEDGKGVSNWDVFTRIAGNIQNNENGEIADDHYHRYLEDIEMMHSLGVNAYRFSISWSRILPRGRFGNVNPKGIEFYNKIIDNLVLREIEPFVTIYHVDMPQILEDRYGGWLSHLVREDFVHFATICFKEFGDRVKYWMTINEPNLLAVLSYLVGKFPPSHCSPPFGNCSVGNSDVEPLVAMHNMLMSHAMAAHIYRNHFQEKQGGIIGIAVNADMYEPFRDDDEADGEAVKRALAFNVAWMFDPLIYGEYPGEMLEYLGLDLPRFSKKERELIKGSLDFIGLNHYSTLYVKDCIHSACSAEGHRRIKGFLTTISERNGVPIGEPTGMSNVFVVPRGMKKIINYLKDRYNNMPIFVTENGYPSKIEQNEQVKNLLQDFERIRFHKAYLASLVSAMRDGADVRGYFVWSLLDNFEWTFGYSVRFGLYYIDRITGSLQRTPKLSASWFTNFLTNSTTNIKYVA